MTKLKPVARSLVATSALAAAIVATTLPAHAANAGPQFAAQPTPPAMPQTPAMPQYPAAPPAGAAPQGVPQQLAPMPRYGYGAPYGSWGSWSTPWNNGPWNNGPWNNGSWNNSPWNSGPFGNWGGWNMPWSNNGPYSGGWGTPWNNGPWNNGSWNNSPFGNWGGMRNWGNGPGPNFGVINPWDPKGSASRAWDEALNTPNKMGRMPGGWRAPTVSVPNPVDVADELGNAAEDFPDQMRNQLNNFNFN